MKHLLTFFAVSLLTACTSQRTSYIPKAPGFQIMGKKIVREGYVITQNGTQAFTMNREYAGFCYDRNSLLYVLGETDSLLTVTDNSSEKEQLFYVHKKAIGTEPDITLDNTDLNEPFREGHYYQQKHFSGDNCGEAGELPTADAFNPEDYPDIEVNLITEKEFRKMKRTAVEHFEVNEAIKKTDSTITIAGKGFQDGRGEGNLPNTFYYEGEIKALNGYLLLYVCEACEEYEHILVDKGTGETIGSFANAPRFSADLNYVMDIGQLFSDSPTIVRVNKWKDKEGHGSYKEFGNWSPVGEGFWGSDNCFYTAVIPSITAENHNRDSEVRNAMKYNFRYVRVRIKADTPYTEEGGYMPPLNEE
jgi:hypothetical protein